MQHLFTDLDQLDTQLGLQVHESILFDDLTQFGLVVQPGEILGAKFGAAFSEGVIVGHVCGERVALESLQAGRV